MPRPFRHHDDSGAPRAANHPVTTGVLGAGAMGSLLAGRLALAGEPVVLLARPSPHANRVRSHGLAIESLDGNTCAVSVPVAFDPTSAADLDALVVLVKRWATRDALAPLAPHLRSAALVVSLQNGIGAREDLRSALPAHPWAPLAVGVTAQAALLPSVGVVRHTGEGDTVIGVGSGVDASVVARFAARLERAGWNCRLEPDIEPAIWRKLAVNAAINGITALASVPNGAIVERADLRVLAGRIVDEVTAVAASVGVDIGDAREAALTVAEATRFNRSSMLQDLDRGRRTEVDVIHGAVVDLARRGGIDAPVVEVLSALIRARDSAPIAGHRRTTR